MRALLAGAVLGVALLTAGCRGDAAEPAGGGPDVQRQFDGVESTLADIESDLRGD